jgi:hypothetical protein
MGIEQHRAPVVQMLHCVGVHIRVRVLQAVEVLHLILTPLPFQNTDVLMWGALLGAEQEEIGFAGALGIRHHDIRGNRRLHNDSLHCAAVLAFRTLDVAMGAG